MIVDIRDSLTDLVQRAIDEAIAYPDRAAARIDRLLPPGSVPAVEGWPSPSLHARVRAQIIVCDALSALEALDPRLRGDVVYTELRELPEVGYEFKPCAEIDELDLAPLISHCLSAEAGRVLATLAAYRFTPTLVRKAENEDEDKEEEEGEGKDADLLQGRVRRGISRRLNAFALVESNLWYLASLGDPDIVVPYAVRYDLARLLWDRQQPGHIFCLRCGEHVHYKHPARARNPRKARCRPCSRGEPDAWPANAIEPHTRGTWWRLCRAECCIHVYIGRTDQFRCPHCRLDTTTPSRRKPLAL
jgi:hypothetical protein